MKNWDYGDGLGMEKGVAYVGYGVECRAFEARRLDWVGLPGGGFGAEGKAAIRERLAGFSAELEFRDAELGLWAVADRW